jgi:hypothetical protein
MDTKEIKTTNARTHEQAVDIARARSKAENGRILDARERYIPNAKVVINSLIHDIGARELLRILADHCEEQARGFERIVKDKNKAEYWDDITRAIRHAESLARR